LAHTAPHASLLKGALPAVVATARGAHVPCLGAAI